MWDYDLAPYVARSFIKHAQDVSNILVIELDSDFREKCLDYYNKNSTLISAKEFLAELGVTERVYSEAYRLTDRETHQAMQAVIHNLNTMNCLTGQAQVLMADGTTKSIAKIMVGDSVVSLNQQTGALENKRVVETFDNGIQMVRDYTFEDGTVITVTPSHKALCHGVYTPIEACESVDGTDGTSVKIVSKSELREEHVYDIEVDGNHNFVGDGKFFHNCRAGAQVPFSSINYGTDTSPEGRMIIKATLDETDNGLGGGETPIFPVQVFKFKRSVNGERGTPNYDLFQLSCKVSAKRLFPNYGLIDSWYNKQYYKEGHPETEMAVMGCASGDEKIVYRYQDTIYERSFKDAWEHLSSLGFETVENPRASYIKLEGVEILDRDRFVGCKGILRNKDIEDWLIVSAGDKQITVTSDHPLRVNDTRTQAQDIKAGDTIYVR